MKKYLRTALYQKTKKKQLIKLQEYYFILLKFIFNYSELVISL